MNDTHPWTGLGLHLSPHRSPVSCFLTYAAYGFSSLGIVTLSLIISIGALIFFVYWETKTPYPLLDLRLLEIPQFTGGTIAVLLNAISWGALLLILSLYFQIGLGMDPLHAGISILPFEFAFLATGPISGKLSDRFGKVPFTVTGLAIQSAALFLFSTNTIATPYYYSITYMVIFGAGVGLFASPNMSAVMLAAPPNRRGIASALRNTC
jgi:hypothetical protein